MMDMGVPTEVVNTPLTTAVAFTGLSGVLQIIALVSLAAIQIAIDSSDVLNAELIEATFMPDVFDDELAPDVEAYINDMYDDDDWPMAITPDIIDNLSTTPDLVDNLANTIADQFHDYLNPTFRDLIPLLDNVASQLRSGNFNLNSYEYRATQQLLANMTVYQDNLYDISTILRNVMRPTER